MMKKIFLPLILFCFFISSCSRLDIAVQFATTYVAHKANDYFDLNSEQTKWLKINFDKNFAKLEKIIFPQIATELISASNVISHNRQLDSGEIKLAYERLKNLIYDGVRIFSTDAILFADQLTPKQIIYFQKEFDDKMQDLKADESAKKTYKKIKSQFDLWMGSMTLIQKKELENFSNTYPPLTDEKVSNRKQLVREFVSAYSDKERRHHFVETLTKEFDRVYEGKFSQLTKDRNNKLIHAITSILNQMTDSQRMVLVETLKDRAKQLLKISQNIRI